MTYVKELPDRLFSQHMYVRFHPTNVVDTAVLEQMMLTVNGDDGSFTTQIDDQGIVDLAIKLLAKTPFDMVIHFTNISGKVVKVIKFVRCSIMAQTFTSDLQLRLKAPVTVDVRIVFSQRIVQ